MAVVVASMVSNLFYWLLPFVYLSLSKDTGMAITLHRDALKTLASVSIDASFCQQQGSQVFTYAGEITPPYQHLCKNFAAVVDQLIQDLQSLRDQTPCLYQDETFTDEAL